MKIHKGKQKKPRRTVLYGTHGIGKSTWAAQAESPIFISTEDGLGDIDCESFELCKQFKTVDDALRYLAKENHEYKTVVIDSLDWLERLIHLQICIDNGNLESIDMIGYGKGYTFALAYWREFLNALEYLRNNKNMAIILISHADVKHYEEPGGEGYDRYDLALHKKASPMIQEWADEVLFAQYVVHTVSEGDGFNEKIKGKGTGERIVKTQERPAQHAKNRLGMPEEIPFSYQAYKSYFSNKGDTK